MDAAVRNYDSYITGEYAWMLGRLIVPAARLEEYAEAVRNAGIDASAWSLSVLATAGDAAAIARFDTGIGRAGADESGAAGSGSIDVLESKAAHAREIQDAAQAFGGRYQLYFETPPEKWHALLQATAVAKARAKIRTGGEVASAIPEESRVLEFLRIASERRLAFKATAGLHHPHIVQVHNFGTHEGMPYLILEYVEGGTLLARLKGTPQTPREAAALVPKP